MAIPANWSVINLVGYLVDDDNNPASTYSVRVESSQTRLQDAISHRVIFPKADTVTPGSDGYFCVPAVVSDTDTDITPSGRSHKITLVRSGAAVQSWFVTIDHSAAIQLRFDGNNAIVSSGGTLTDAMWITSLTEFTDAPTVTPVNPGGGVGAGDLSDYFTKTGTNAAIESRITALKAEQDPFSQYATNDELTAAAQDATTSVKGRSRILGGTADNPTVPYGKVTGAPASLPPSGGAGGVLAGSYPNPSFAVDMATQVELDTGLAAKADTVHGHTSASISDFTEAVQDAVGALLGAGSNVVVNYDDAANSLTISATSSGGTGLDAEQVRDAIGVALVGVGNITVTVNDAADTITITTTATQNSSDAALRDRSTHTNTQSADTVDETAGRKWLTAAERTKLGGVATGATAYTDEQAQDAAAALLTGGTHTGVGFVYDDAAGKVNATVTGGGGGASTLPVWKPNTTYAAGDRVLAPSGVLAIRKTAGTTAVPYDPENWAEIGASRQVLQRLDIVESGWTPPAPGISSAVAATPDGGGPRYFEQFPAAQALAAPDYFPTAVWSAQVLSRADVIRDRDSGLNLYINLYGGTAGLAIVGRDARMWVILQSGEAAPSNWAEILSANPTTPGAERVVGWKLYDEVDMTSGATTDGIPKLDARLATLPPGDGRFRYNNVGKGVAFWETEQSAARFVNYQHVTSIDIYWFTDNDLFGMYQGGQLVYTDGDATTQAALSPDQAHLGYNYAAHIRRMRRFTKPTAARPIWGFVELGHPFTDNSWPTITGPEAVSAAWHQIIAGATGIIYFNHSFGGTVTSNVLRDPNYTATRAAITSLNARFANLARVLNAPHIDNWGLATSGGKVATSVRIVGGKYYLLAASAQRNSATVTFTLPAGLTASHATALHENRAGIAISGGAFSDTFADHNAVHIYRLDNASITDPAPTLPQHYVFDGFGTGRTSTSSLGTPDIGPAWAIGAGSFGVDADGYAYQPVDGGNNRATVNSVGAGAGALRSVRATVGPSSLQVGMIVHCASDGSNGYLVKFNDGSLSLKVEEWGGPVHVTIASPQPGQTVEVRLKAAGLHEIYYDGVYKGAWTDTTWTGNYDGLFFQGLGAGRLRDFAVSS